MTAQDLLHITLALMRDAELPTEEKLAVLETASTLIRENAESEEKARGKYTRARKGGR